MELSGCNCLICKCVFRVKDGFNELAGLNIYGICIGVSFGCLLNSSISFEISRTQKSGLSLSRCYHMGEEEKD